MKIIDTIKKNVEEMPNISGFESDIEKIYDALLNFSATQTPKRNGGKLRRLYFFLRTMQMFSTQQMPGGWDHQKIHNLAFELMINDFKNNAANLDNFHTKINKSLFVKAYGKKFIEHVPYLMEDVQTNYKKIASYKYPKHLAEAIKQLYYQ